MSGFWSSAWYGAMVLAALPGVGALFPIHAQRSQAPEGEYALTLYRADTRGVFRPSSMVLVLTQTAIPAAIADRLPGVNLRRMAPAKDHGACWHFIVPDSLAGQAAGHTTWRPVGDSVRVLVWRSPDAGLELTLAFDGDVVRGRGFTWRWNGSTVRDSVAGRRIGPLGRRVR